MFNYIRIFHHNYSSILHGRPFPLKGKLFANVFCHFEPINHQRNIDEVFKHKKMEKHKLRQAENRAKRVRRTNRKIKLDEERTLKQQQEEELEQVPQLDDEMLRYLASRDIHDIVSDEEHTSILHQLAQAGELDTIRKVLKGKSIKDVEYLVNTADSNGWQPLHEAVRGENRLGCRV